MFCSRCGKEIDNASRFCGHCGNKIRNADAGVAPSTAATGVGGGNAGIPAAYSQPAVTANGGAGVTPPVTATAVGAGTAGARGSSTLKTALKVAVPTLIVCVVAIGVFIFLNARNATTGDAGGGTVQTTVKTQDGTEVSALDRVTLISALTDDEVLAAAPALSGYLNLTLASSDDSGGSGSSGDSGSSGSSGGAGGDSGSAGGSGGSGGSDDSGGSGDSGSSGSSDGAASDSGSSGGSGDNGSSSDSGDGGSGDSSSSGTGTATITTSASGNVEQSNPYGSVFSYTVESGLTNVVNASDFGSDISSEARSLIEQNSFAVVSAEYDSLEFYEVYEMNRYSELANFVTVDSMMHTYHTYFAYLLKGTEKSSLASTLTSLSKSMMTASEQQLEALSGSEWESAARRNVVFFSVAACLLDGNTEVLSSVASDVQSELDAIYDASSTQESVITGDFEDYSQYKPRGYYEGDSELEAYFRAMMWYGRINFMQSDEDLDRSAALMTLAMEGDVLAEWEEIYAITSFFAGASDDNGYYEYRPLLEAIYGADPTVESLLDNADGWSQYHELTALMKAPQISSLVVMDEGVGENEDAEQKGFRFMGQRFSLDESIFDDLIYSEVDLNSNGEKRLLPNALDVPAALGSNEALSILEAKGETEYGGYSENMEELRTSIASASSTIWTSSLYAQWLYTLNPLLVSKGEGYPSFMQSSAWDRKNLQTYLGSYTELKHDTVLYSKQVVAELGGGEVNHDDRGYVEPEPEVFTRLANLTKATSEGLDRYGAISTEDKDNLALLQELAQKLADIAKKELASESLTDDEYDLIRTYGGQIEHFWDEVNEGNYNSSSNVTKSQSNPAAVVADIATNPNGTVLEVGTGRVSTIYVVVPIDGELHLTSGGVYSFYQFEQPSSNRLTDSEWREMMGITTGTKKSSSAPVLEDWTSTFQIAE